jgi:hypothetical protein
MSTSALTDAIYQNTPGNSEGFPLGVPTGYSWYVGDSGFTDSVPPSDFSAVTGWGQIYPEVGQPVVAGNIQIANSETWVHSTTLGWIEVQDQATGTVNGAHFVADFSGNRPPRGTRPRCPTTASLSTRQIAAGTIISG